MCKFPVRMKRKHRYIIIVVVCQLLNYHKLMILLAFSAGVIEVMRTLGKVMSPVVELTKNADGKHVLTCNTMIRDTSIEFNLNEEFVEETLDAHKVRSIITQEGNKLVHVQKGSSNRKETTIIREFEPDRLTMVI